MLQSRPRFFGALCLLCRLLSLPAVHQRAEAASCVASNAAGHVATGTPRYTLSCHTLAPRDVIRKPEVRSTQRIAPYP